MGWREIAIAFVWYFNIFVLFYFLALNTIYLVLFFISLREVFRFVRRTFFSDYGQIMQSEMTWPISILVPAHNEEKTIVETVRSLQMINYGEFEIIVINDGSTDGTLQRLREAYDLGRVDKVYRRSIETEPVRAVYSADYASRHDLPPTPTLQRALSGLVQKEIVAQGRDGEYRIVEPFLAEWLRREEAAT